MDWAEEYIEKIRKRIQNLSLRKALAAYLLLALFAGAGCGWLLGQTALHQCRLILYENGFLEDGRLAEGILLFLRPEESTGVLSITENQRLWFWKTVWQWASWIAVGLCLFAASVLFYRGRLKKPLRILKEGMEEMQGQNLDFAIQYDSADEMGELCRTVDALRRETVADRERLWEAIEEQKKINAAFAHDLRTPLTVLKGYSELLHRYVPEGKISQEKLVQTLGLMTGHLERLERYSHTMRELRTFEEIEPVRERLELRHLLERIEETVRPLNAVGDIRISCQGKGEGEIPLFADEFLILEVLENLLSNALRFAKSQVEIWLEQEGDRLWLYVHDDGPGFSKRERELAGNPYFQGTGGQKEEHFGIGLYICKRLAKSHGGTLNLANGTRGGAFVTVSFSCRKS